MKRYYVRGPFVEKSEASRHAVSDKAWLVVRAEDADVLKRHHDTYRRNAEKLEEENTRLEAENERLQEECSARRMDCKKLQADLAAAKERERALREAADSALAAVWDAYYGKGIAVDYARAIDAKVKQALVRKESDDG